ncbi:alpha/beta hydrolase [Gordonia sp. PKS22-38]|uniref:Alpha/beta hydrolase n=1 Tax=Gordonia prachuapensis TaxID=3115651 RepID=A0ABU7MSK0_9ACTN|nr:alpha/beta hydrolase [Gordonia sp. PKS22-38]
MKRCAVHREKVEYGSAPSQFGHVYLPSDGVAAGVTVRPVVLIHGGYWTTEFGLTIETAVARLFAERRAMVWNVEYRRVGEDGGGWPGTGRDVVAALRALDGPVREAVPDAVAAQVDWSSVAVVGHSAGGQLAVWSVAQLGARTDTCQIDQVIAQSAALDLERAAKRPSVRGLMGRPLDEIPHRYREASPIYQQPFDAHVVALHAELDTAIPVEVSRHYVQTVSAAGQSAELVVVPGEGHDAFVDPLSASTRQTIRLLGI